MEHEKKKKNKQGKANERPPTGVGELSSENADVHNKGLHQRVVDSDRESISGAETSYSIEAESFSLKREAFYTTKNKRIERAIGGARTKGGSNIFL